MSARTPARAKARPAVAGEEFSRREAVIVTAARLFKEQGFDRTTVRDIGDALGFPSGSLFYHFSSKEDILVAVMQDGTRRARERLEAVLKEGVLGGDGLDTLVRAHLEATLHAAPDAMAVVLREWGSLSEDAKRLLVEERDEYEARFAEELRVCADQGLVPSADGLYRLFLLGALTWTIQWFHEPGARSLDEVATAFADFARRAPR